MELMVIGQLEYLETYSGGKIDSISASLPLSSPSLPANPSPSV